LLDHEQLCTTVVALSHVWPLLADDVLPWHLVSELIKAQPWCSATPTSLVRLILAFAKLSGELAMSQARNVWDPVTAGAAAMEAGAELAACLRSGKQLMEADAEQLVESLKGSPSEGNASLMPPQLVAELLKLISNDATAMPDSGDQPPRSSKVSGSSPRDSSDDGPSSSSDTTPQVLAKFGCRSPSTSPPPPEHGAERGRSLRRRRRRRRCAHSHGHGHGHGQGHSHGHGHRRQEGPDAEEEPDSEPCEDFSKAHRVGHAHGHVQACPAKIAAHIKNHKTCGDENCCKIFEETVSEMRLNTNCDFPGHCVQLKNTFLHIPCNDTDSDTECVVCHFARSSSAGPLRCKSTGG